LVHDEQTDCKHTAQAPMNLTEIGIFDSFF
jgi:hypothetical protein